MTAKAHAGGDGLNHRLGCPSRHVRAERQIQLEIIGVRQPAFQMGGKAVARHDVEAYAGQERNALRLGFGVPRGEGFEHVDFTGDVEVVDAIAKAGVRHRFRRRRERTGDAEHRRNVLDGGVDPAGIAKIKCACGEAERFGNGSDISGIASGQDRECALVDRNFRDQLAGVAGGAVDQDCSAQTDSPPNETHNATTAGGGHGGVTAVIHVLRLASITRRATWDEFLLGATAENLRKLAKLIPFPAPTFAS